MGTGLWIFRLLEKPCCLQFRSSLPSASGGTFVVWKPWTESCGGQEVSPPSPHYWNGPMEVSTVGFQWHCMKCQLLLLLLYIFLSSHWDSNSGLFLRNFFPLKATDRGYELCLPSDSWAGWTVTHWNADGLNTLWKHIRSQSFLIPVPIWTGC